MHRRSGSSGCEALHRGLLKDRLTSRYYASNGLTHWVAAMTNRSTVVSRTFLLGLTRYFCFEARSFPEFTGRQPFVREPSLRPTNDATNYLGRNMELPCNFGSRMGSLTAKPEVQADYLFLQWAQDPQEP